MCLSDELDEYTKCSVCEMSEKVINSLAFKHEKIKKKVTEVMGGQVLEYAAKNILNRGINQGESLGITKGENKLARLIKSSMQITGKMRFTRFLMMRLLAKLCIRNTE